jgi:Domain of unknown function (DUF927)
LDTTSFLSHILPNSGLYCLAEFFSSGAVKHHFFNDINEAAQAVIDINSRTTVYHACASYKTNENRKQVNVDKVKTFFLDLDVGPTKEYANLDEAKQAITHLCTKLGLHVPTIVLSGRGLHVYFVFESAVSADVWKAGALLFRQVLDTIGFKHDPSRTTDQASILRPVGSTWRKEGEKAVRCVHVSAPKPFGFYIEKFNTFSRENNLAPVIAPPSSAAMSLFKVEQLGTKSEYPPSSIITVASLCSQLARMRDLRGAVSEPEWRNAIGVIKHCTEGTELAHEWSSGDPRYDRAETQAKLDRWETGPTTCETFERTNSHICASCKFKGKIRSPIQLGYVEKIEAPAELKQPESVSQKDVDLKQFWPDGFRWDKDSRRLLKLQRVDDVPEWVSFCSSFFYPTTRVQLADGTWAQRVTMEVNPGKYREFDLPTKHLASPDALCTALASHEVVIEHRKGYMAVAYIEGFRERLQRAEVEMKQHKHFGWISGDDDFDNFIIGTEVIRKDGTVGKCLLNDDIRHNRFLYEGILASGSDTEWARHINQAYNREGAEVFQFTLMAMLSSPIIGMLGVDQWHGIPVGLTGASGQGKTTVGRAAASAYGPPKMFVFNAANMTGNAPDPFLGLMHNLPLVLDEYTGKDPALVSTHLYGMSTGHGRIRLTQKGELSPILFTWNTVPLVTGNTNINEAMQTLARTQADASQVRVFEYSFQGHEAATIFKGENIQEILEHKLSEHYGHVGRTAIRLMMSRRAQLRADFEVLRAKYGHSMVGFDTKERYFVDLIATAELGGRIFKELGYIQWDVDHVISWARKHMEVLRSLRSEGAYSIDDRAAQFIGSLSGSILATKTMGRTNEPPMDSHQIRGEIKARMAVNDRKFFVSSRAFDEWCRAIGMQASYMRTELTTAGYIIPSEEPRQFLTKGTNIPSARQRVMEFNFDKVSSAISVEGKVVSIA